MFAADAAAPSLVLETPWAARLASAPSAADTRGAGPVRSEREELNPLSSRPVELPLDLPSCQMGAGGPHARILTHR